MFSPNHLQFVIKLPSNYIALLLMLNSVEVARKLRATCSVQDSNGFPKAAATTKDFCALKPIFHKAGLQMVARITRLLS